MKVGMEIGCGSGDGTSSWAGAHAPSSPPARQTSSSLRDLAASEDRDFPPKAGRLPITEPLLRRIDSNYTCEGNRSPDLKPRAPPVVGLRAMGLEPCAECSLDLSHGQPRLDLICGAFYGVLPFVCSHILARALRSHIAVEVMSDTYGEPMVDAGRAGLQMEIARSVNK